jgi:hypothetical protein
MKEAYSVRSLAASSEVASKDKSGIGVDISRLKTMGCSGVGVAGG